MKTKNPASKICPSILVLLSFLIVASSCRKNDTDYQNIPTPPPSASTPVVFQNNPIRMMSDYEIAEQRDFPGHILHLVGKGIAGGEDPSENPLKEISETLWEVYDYEHTEHEFSEIKQDLTNLTGQIDALSQTMTNMGQHLSIQIDDLQAFITTGDLNTQISYVKTAMGSGTEDQFMFYSNTAAAWEANPTNSTLIIRMDTLKNYMPKYTNRIYHSMLPNSMPNIIQSISDDLCPAIGSDTNALQAYAKTLVTLCNGKVTDSTDAMNAYLLLESYFLTAVNYQLQAATIMVNACNFIDSTGVLGYDSIFIANDVVPPLKTEIGVFLSAVDYFVANIGEYRSMARFTNDMQYADAGLAPDEVFIHVLARSQFIANLLYDAMGLPCPVMCGHIVVPSKYPANPQQPLTVTVGTQQVTGALLQLASQLPYTYWEGTTCHPDKTWNSYRYGKLGTPDMTWPTGKQPIVISSTAGQTPWVHFSPISGTVTPLYYNPRDPSQTSSTKTSECTTEFAYFSASWQWGYLLLTNSPLSSGWQKTTVGGAFDFESFNSTLVGSTLVVPFAATGKKQYMVYQTGGLTFSNPNGTAGSMAAGGTTGKTGDYYVIVDGNWLDITTGSDLPDMSGTIEAWAIFSSRYTMQGSGGVDMTVNIGTTRLEETHPGWTGDKYYTVGDDVVRINFHDLIEHTNTGSGSSPALKTGTSYQPGVQYYYQTANLAGSVPGNLYLTSAYQFVYGGYYFLP